MTNTFNLITNTSISHSEDKKKYLKWIKKINIDVLLEQEEKKEEKKKDKCQNCKKNSQSPKGTETFSN